MKRSVKDAAFSLVILLVSFTVNMIIRGWLQIETLIPTIFVLGVFLISWRTEGYFWGIAASLLSVLAVNYAFTYPYYVLDLISPECVTSAIVMLIVSILTSMMTTQIKRQEKIKAEIERERMRANLLRAVSHDLRTPLTAIYGASATVTENYNTLDEEQKRKLLKDVQSDAQWLIRMVENLLSVTRIDGGKVQLTKMPTVLEELIDTVLVKFRKHFPEQDVAVQIPEEFVSIPMDAILIEQVLINLLENAALHAKGMEMLELIVTCRDGRATFCVQDDGCGIPQEKMDGLFTGKYDRKDGPSDGTRHNMGIGLSVCAAIVKAHGSEIRGENRVPRGTAFHFSLEMEEENEYESLQDPDR